MVFSSHIFLYYFLPLVLTVYFLVPRRARSAFLIIASAVFYGWSKPWFVGLAAGSALIDFTAGALIARDQQEGRRGGRWLAISITSQLALLAWFKYANFGVATWNMFAMKVGLPVVHFGEPVELPPGISFYTFQTMSYTIDVYRREVKKADSFVDFLCYVTMFPQLVSGPIVRYVSIADQVRSRTLSRGKFSQGVLMLQTGLAKKLLIADILASTANLAFSATTLGVGEHWIGILAYTFQIYFDFSGYSDMAIGLALMLGFRYPINFNQPYRANSVTDFWRRWHISLSTWLRDYLYVPLGGNRRGALRTYVNLGLTMLLGGLWHGANWTFIAWGAWQGFWLIIERLAGRKSLVGFAPLPVQIAFTFGLTMLGWVFFKANSMWAATTYLAGMFGFGPHVGPPGALMLGSLDWLVLSLAAVITWTMPSTQQLASRLRPWFVAMAQVLFILALLQLHRVDNVPFLYFRF